MHALDTVIVRGPGAREQCPNIMKRLVKTYFPMKDMVKLTLEATSSIVGNIKS